MAYSANVVEILIASPSDVVGEKQIARDVILKWNQINARQDALIFMPRMWELDATPEMGSDPQEVINKQIVKDSDLIVAILWTRVGTPTPRADSGTIEEITQHLEAGKPALIYFSRKPIPYHMQFDQRDALKEFEAKAKSYGVLGEFKDDTEFRERLRDDIERTAHRILARLQTPEATTPLTASTISLSEKAFTLLAVAAKSNNLQFIKMSMAVGVRVWSGNTVFTESNDARDIVAWKSAIDELLLLGFCRDLNGRGQMFELSQNGLNFLEKTLRDRFEMGSDVYVVATVRKSYEGNGAPPEQRLRYIVRMPRSLVEGEEIEWNYDFILEDNKFRFQVLGMILRSDGDDGWPYRKTWNWEKFEVCEGDPKSLSRDYKQMGNGCLIWDVSN